MNRSKLVILVVAVALAIGAVAFLSGGDPSPGLISNSELADLQSGGARIIDVRTTAEFAGAHIAGAENVPLGDLASVAGSWERTAPVVVYCAVGDRSDSAADILQSLGFEAVYDLGGGIAQWDGELAGGAAASVAGPEVQMAGLPVMYEFYTDW